ncbi:MAG: ADP-forming succinate--CoA ligase subunit beta [Pseudomonadota bacterium]|nr:ADP-forming succinate--CoA ligase subunit beta [Pseudomonadota bacterium]
MNIHEYQAKKLLSKYGVAILPGLVVTKAGEAEAAARELGGKVWVVKAQIHAGGRGKGYFVDFPPDSGGGVRLAKSLEEVRRHSDEMLGSVLVTNQTGSDGREVRGVYIEEGCEIKTEFYVSILVDRVTSRVTIISSTEGGMDIEEVAENMPDKILTTSIDPMLGLQQYQARQIAYELGLNDGQIRKAVKFLTALYETFVQTDASLLEINPMVLTKDDEIIALDAKMNFDDNALCRQSEIEKMRDENEQDPKELEAERSELNYIKLDGSIGCMVNGAGLAMATMDIIKLYGGDPANFLDVGGGATEERVAKAFKIILSDSNVRGILVNIFGGIMRCDVIAEGVVKAAKEVSLDVPLVVRLAGTNVNKGEDILAKSGLQIVSAGDLGDAAKKVVKAVEEASV